MNCARLRETLECGYRRLSAFQVYIWIGDSTFQILQILYFVVSWTGSDVQSAVFPSAVQTRATGRRG